MLNAVALFRQFLLSGFHFGAAEVVNVNALHNFPLAIFAAAGEGVDQAFLNAVAAIAVYAHRYPVVAVSAQRPAAYMVDRRVGCRGGRRRAAGFNDGGAALLHGRDKVIFQPVLVNQV